MKTKLIISLLAFAAITTLASGQNDDVNTRPLNGQGQGPAYVDSNKNNICDNYENRTTNFSSRRGQGPAYVDSNKNGICDNNENRTTNFNGRGPGQRQGQGRGQRGYWQGQGRGRNFVDADKNGICDYREIPAKK